MALHLAKTHFPMTAGSACRALGRRPCTSLRRFAQHRATAGAAAAHGKARANGAGAKAHHAHAEACSTQILMGGPRPSSRISSRTLPLRMSRSISIVCAPIHNAPRCIGEETRNRGSEIAATAPKSQCDLRTRHRHRSTRMSGLADTALRVAFAVDSANLGNPLKRRASIHGAWVPAFPIRRLPKAITHTPVRAIGAENRTQSEPRRSSADCTTSTSSRLPSLD